MNRLQSSCSELKIELYDDQEATAAFIVYSLRLAQREVNARITPYLSNSVVQSRIFRTITLLLTSAMCPWCQQRDHAVDEQTHVTDCTTCGYGKRHLPCEQPGSNWKEIYYSLNQYNVVGMYASPEIALKNLTETVERYIDYPLRDVFDRLINLLEEKGE